MDGQGVFKHSNGTSVLDGNFRRNQFEKVSVIYDSNQIIGLIENCYINLLDEEHQHERVIKRLVGLQKEKADAALKLQAQ